MVARVICFLAIAVVILALPGSNCWAQKDDPALARKLRKMPLWKKTVISERQLGQYLRGLRSGQPAQQEKALKGLAEARPIPKHTRAVMAAVAPARNSDVDWVQAAYFAICQTWESAEKAAEMQRRAGSYARLQAIIASGGVSEKFDAINALSHTDDPAAAEILVASYGGGAEKLKVAAGLKEMGPIAAPAVMKMIQSADTRVQLAGLGVLEEIGTKQQLPALRALTANGKRGIVALKAKGTIEAIEKSGR